MIIYFKKRPRHSKSLIDVKIPCLTWVVPRANKMNMTPFLSSFSSLTSQQFLKFAPLPAGPLRSRHPYAQTFLHLGRCCSAKCPPLITLTPIFRTLPFIFQAATHPIPSLWNIPWPTPSKVNFAILWSTINKHALGIFHVSSKMPGAGDILVNKPKHCLCRAQSSGEDTQVNPYEMCWVLRWRLWKVQWVHRAEESNLV